MIEPGEPKKISHYSPCNEEAYALELEDQAEIALVAKRLQRYFEGHVTQALPFRNRALKALRSWLKEHETEMLDAVCEDTGLKPREAYLAELDPVYRSIRLALANDRNWASPQKTNRSISPFKAKVELHHSPLGTVAILGGEEHPLQELLEPLVFALAAGNCVLLVPHEANTSTGKIVRKLCHDSFDSRYVFCLPADKVIKNKALSCKFAKIFISGSEDEGIATLHASADTLSPVELNLKSKNVYIIDKGINAWAFSRKVAKKHGTSNNEAKQASCATDDFLLIHEEAVSEFSACMNKPKKSAQIHIWKESDRSSMAKKAHELGSIRNCYLITDDEDFLDLLLKQLACDLLFINDYPVPTPRNHVFLPNSTGIAAAKHQANAGFDCFSLQKTSLRKPKLLELPLRVLPCIGKNPLPRLFARHNASTKEK